jgi:hypothetical protein
MKRKASKSIDISTYRQCDRSDLIEMVNCMGKKQFIPIFVLFNFTIL